MKMRSQQGLAPGNCLTRASAVSEFVWKQPESEPPETSFPLCDICIHSLDCRSQFRCIRIYLMEQMQTQTTDGSWIHCGVRFVRCPFFP